MVVIAVVTTFLINVKIQKRFYLTDDLQLLGFFTILLYPLVSLLLELHAWMTLLSHHGVL